MASNETISLCSLIWNRVFDSQVPMGDSCSLEKNLIELRFFFFFEVPNGTCVLELDSQRCQFQMRLHNEIFSFEAI